MRTHLSPQIISAAIAGFEQQKLEIDRQIGELRAMLSGDAAVNGAPKARRTLSAAARKRIAAAQKARWAKVRSDAAPAPKAKRKLSAAMRAKLAANLRKARAAKAAKARAAAN